jgi:hypothetical protein
VSICLPLSPRTPTRSALHTKKKGRLRYHKRPKSREETPKEGSDSGMGLGGATAWRHVRRSRPAAQLNVGKRRASKGVKELYQGLWRSPLCRCWIKNGLDGADMRLPDCPDQRTSTDLRSWSVWCQRATSHVSIDSIRLQKSFHSGRPAICNGLINASRCS